MVRALATICLLSCIRAAKIGPCFVYDVYCMDHPTNTPDGSDPRVEPYKHYVGCLINVAKCRTSGFGLMCKDPSPTGNFQYKKTYVFDAPGSATAEAFIRTLGSSEANICVTLDANAGAADGSGVMSLSNVNSFSKADGCSTAAAPAPGGSATCTTGPEGKACMNGGTPSGSSACTCACMEGYAGKWCEEKSGGSMNCPKSNLGRSDITCVHTVQEGMASLHYGMNDGAKTMSICCVNEKGDGWMGCGPGMQMVGTMPCLGEGNAPVEVYEITSQSKPTKKATDSGIKGLENTVEDGKRIVCCSVPYSKLQPRGEESLDAAKFAWAMGSGPQLEYHAANKGTFSVDFMEGSSSSPPILLMLHLLCMMLAFLVLYPIGVLIAAYAGPGFHRGSGYFQAHRFTMLLALGATLVGVVCGVLNSPFDTVHGYLGILVTVICLTQPINGFLRPNKSHPHRGKWDLLHKSTGRLALVLGFFTAILGAIQYGERGYTAHVVVLLGVIAFALIAILLWGLVLSRRQKPTNSSGKPGDKRGGAVIGSEAEYSPVHTRGRNNNYKQFRAPKEAARGRR